MPTFSEEGWVAICHRKLVVNLSLFLAHSGSFFRSLSPQKSKEKSAAMYPAVTQHGFLFIFIFFPFFMHTPKCFFPCNRVSESVMELSVTASFHILPSHSWGSPLLASCFYLLSVAPVPRTIMPFTPSSTFQVLFSSPFFVCMC